MSTKLGQRRNQNFNNNPLLSKQEDRTTALKLVKERYISEK
jgi:hypothetical protein